MKICETTTNSCLVRFPVRCPQLCLNSASTWRCPKMGNTSKSTIFQDLPCKTNSSLDFPPKKHMLSFWDTIWLFNIAMENPRTQWWFIAGKISYFGPLYHGYVSHNQRPKRSKGRLASSMPHCQAAKRTMLQELSTQP